MVDEKKSSGERESLEMRVAAIEDKLARLNITEEEMRAYEKVSAALGQAAGTDAGGVSAAVCQPCQISRSRLVCIARSIIPRQIVRYCVECNECGPCACGGFSGGGFTGGFGSFGM